MKSEPIESHSAPQEAQAAFWDFTEAKTQALEAIRTAEAAIREADAGLLDLARTYPNNTFRAFRPEDIEAAMRADLEQWEL